MTITSTQHAFAKTKRQLFMISQENGHQKNQTRHVTSNFVIPGLTRNPANRSLILDPCMHGDDKLPETGDFFNKETIGFITIKLHLSFTKPARAT
jgi:hypothetical protein